MRVVVTGATGFVGQHVVSRLLENGHEVTAVARDARKARALGWYKHVHFVAQDIHAKPPDSAWSRHDAVMHLAWPGLPNYERPVHIEETLFADYRFIRALILNGLRHLLVTGTCFEYGFKNGKLCESDPTDPVNSYAIAKDSLRRFLQALQSEIPFTLQWARLFYMYGPGQNPNSLMAQLDGAIAEARPSFDMSGGEQLRDYLPVEQVARALVALFEHPATGGVINICSGVPVSVRNLVEQRLRERGAVLRLNLGAKPYSPFEPIAFWGDNRRLTEVPGAFP